jgi:hypothetical protein
MRAPDALALDRGKTVESDEPRGVVRCRVVVASVQGLNFEHSHGLMVVCFNFSVSDTTGRRNVPTACVPVPGQP